MGTMARTALTAFAGLDAPEQWPRPRSAPRPELLGASVQTLHGVGPTLARRLARLGLATVGDLLWQRPRRYEEPVPAKRICDLFGDEEAVLEGVIRSVTSRRRGRLKILTARVADETGEIKATWFNQPWLEGTLVAGTAVRIRGRANKFGFAVSSYDLDGDSETGDFAPVYPATEDLAQKKLRDLHLQTLERVRAVGDDLPAALLAAERLPLRADALVRGPSPPLAARGRGRTHASRVRRAARPPARARSYRSRTRARVCGNVGCAGRARHAVSRDAPVHTHAGPGARTGRARRRPRPPRPHAASPPGRGRIREDRRRAVRAPPCGRGGATGSAHGADGDARRAALPHRGRAVRAARGARHAPHELSSREGARGSTAAHRLRGCADRRRDARADPEGGRLLATSRLPWSTSSTASALRSGQRARRRARARTSCT